jgi:hypothetical protein
LPAAGKVRDTLPLGVSGMFPPVGWAALNVTLCVSANVHVTVPPGAMVTVLGLNAVPVAATLAVEGFVPPPPVTVTVIWVD